MQSKKRISREPNNNRKWNKLHIKLLILFTLVGLFLRIEPIFQDDVIFTYDQGVDISYIRNLVEHKKISLIGRFTGLQGVFMGPFWTWFLAIPYIFSGGNPSANVLYLSIFGLISIWVTYAIVQKYFSQTAALISAFYAAVSVHFIAASQIVITPAPLTILMIVYLWLIWEVVKYNKKQFLLPLGLLIGIFFQLEIGFAVFLLPATIFILVVEKKRNVILSRQGLYGSLLFVIPFIPQILFDLRHDFLISKSILTFFSGKNTSLGAEGQNLFGRSLVRIGSLYEDFSSSIGFIENNLLLVVLVTVPATTGWWNIIKGKEKYKLSFAKVLILLIFAIYFGFSVYPGPVWVWYRAGMPIVFILLIAIGWAKLIDENKSWKIVAILLFMILGFLGTKPKKIINLAMGRDEGGVASIRNQKQALDVIFQDAKKEPFDLYVYTPPVYTYVWDHMTFWYAESKYNKKPLHYGYMPSPESENNFYLLIEPDNIPARIEGWKGNYVVYGDKIKAWLLPGDIRVEKWQRKQTTQKQ